MTVLRLHDPATDTWYAVLAGESSTKVTKTQALGTPATAQLAWTDYEISAVCSRGICSLLTVTSSQSTMWDVQVRSASGGLGTLFLESLGNTAPSYTITAPWYLEGDVNSSIWLRIRNQGSTSSTFSLTALRVEKFA